MNSLSLPGILKQNNEQKNIMGDEVKPNILEVWKQVHVSETIDGHQGQVSAAFAEMLKWMSKFDAIGKKEIDITRFAQQLFVGHTGEHLHALLVIGMVEEDHEWKAFFGQLFRILESDLPNQWNAFVRGPCAQFVVALQLAGKLHIDGLWLRTGWLESQRECGGGRRGIGVDWWPSDPVEFALVAQISGHLPQ